MDNTNVSQLDKVIFMLAEFSRGNFGIRHEVLDGEDPLNTIVAGLNMLGEELDNYKKEITHQRTMLQNILGSIDEVIYVRDVNRDNPAASRYSFVSGRAEEIIGLNEEELARQPDKWIKAIHPEDKARSIEMMRRILHGREIVFTYRSYHYKKQQYRWIEDRVSPRMNAEGEVMHIYGSARDVTEQQETTLELKETTKLVTRLITSSDQVFYIVSIDQDDPFKNTFTYLSPQVERVIGYTVDDVRNDYFLWINAIHPDDVPGVKAITKEMFSTRKAVTRVYRMRNRRTGEYVWLEDYVVPIPDESGWIREFYASARDITARKQAEIEREQLIKELSRRHDELMQFSNIVSHNLRAPVASILGLAQFLNEELSPDEQQKTTGYVLEAAHAMDGVLHDLNAILNARSTLNEKMETFRLQDVIDSVCISLKNEISESGTTIDVAIKQEAQELTSIKSYVQSAIYNLVSNAIKYRAADRPPVIAINAYKADGHPVISVADNGVGIDLQIHRHRLFGLYSRLRTDREGKGLGLYMTKTQIGSLNGSLNVESEPGKGSVFTITL